MKEIFLNGIMIQIIQGDISDQPDVDAIVNAANAELAPGGGVAGAIHRAAGPTLYEECKRYAPIKPGEAVITGAGNLPNKHVIHCLGPRYGIDTPEEELLKNCYRNALRLAEENNLKSVAFPAISTGIFGYPKEDAAKAVAEVLQEVTPSLKTVRLIRFVLYSYQDYATFERVITEKIG